MKRLISLVLAILMTLSFVPLLSSCSSNEEYMTRAEWIEELALGFGLSDYVQTEQYFSDVKSDSEYYDYVQSCVEWNVLDATEKKFKPDSVATNDFAFETALKAAEVDTGESSAVEYATNDGFINDNGYFTVRGKLTAEFAQTIIDWTVKKYVNAEVEPYENVTFSESLIDLSNTSGAVTEIGDGEYRLSGSAVNNVGVDSVIIVPGDEFNPDGIAVKVSEIKDNGNGEYIIKTVEPEIGDIYQDFEFCGTVTPSLEDVVPADGVEIVSAASGTSETGSAVVDFIPATEKADTDETEKGINLSFNINFTKGTCGLTREFSDFLNTGSNISVGGNQAYSVKSALTDNAGELFSKESVIPDKNLIGADPYDNTDAIEAYKNGSMSLDELKKELNLSETQEEKSVSSMTNKFSGGYEITGSLSLKNLYVTPEIKFNKVLGVPVGIDKMSVTVNYDCSANLSVKGKLEETLTVATVPIPIGATGLSVTLELKLFAKLNGSIGVTATISNKTKYEYSDGKNKKTCEKSQSISADASAKLDFGPNITVTIRALGVALVDLGIDVAVRFKAGIGLTYKTAYNVDDENITITRNIVFKRNVDCYIPIITLNIGSKGTLANKLKISFSWELVGESKAYNVDIYDKEDTIWEEVQVIKLREEETTEDEDNESTEEDSNDKKFGEYLSISTYFIYLTKGSSSTITLSKLPSGYDENSLVWSSSDPSVVTVSNGVVTAVKNGSVIITVNTPDGLYTAQCSVTVEDEGVSFTPLEGSIFNL